MEATGESSGRSAQATFDVRTDWAKFHSDDANSGYNRLENVLSPSNVGSLQEAWSFQVSLALEGSPVVAGGLLYVGSEDGNVYALDPTTGTQRWVFTSGGGLAMYTAPAVFHGVVYVSPGDGNLDALDASTGDKLWSSYVGGTSRSSPAVANGVVYVGSLDGNVYAFDAATGARVWSFPRRGRSDGASRPPRPCCPRRPWPTAPCTSGPSGTTSTR